MYIRTYMYLMDTSGLPDSYIHSYIRTYIRTYMYLMDTSDLPDMYTRIPVQGGRFVAPWFPLI